jgi:competence protein ComGC
MNANFPKTHLFRRNRGVTLMEIMAVIIIIVMVIGIAVPSIIGISRGQGVNLGGSMTSSSLLVARGNAMNMRTRHRMVFLGTLSAMSSGSSDFAKVYRAFSVIAKSNYELSDNRSDSWTFVEAWEYLPTGVVFNGASINALPSMTCGMTMDNAVGTFNYIEWRPTGRPTYGGTISVTEGNVSGSGITSGTSITNFNNRADIHFDQLTGRVRVVQP